MYMSIYMYIYIIKNLSDAFILIGPCRKLRLQESSFCVFAFQENKLHTQSISGGIEVMFLQYNPQNSIVRVNVLRGYHLVPRDVPFLTSDPYFKLSISPKWFNQGPLESAPKYGRFIYLRNTRYRV